MLLGPREIIEITVVVNLYSTRSHNNSSNIPVTLVTVLIRLVIERMIIYHKVVDFCIR